MARVALVVAHYSEDLAWMQRVRGVDEVCVVSKSDPGADVYQPENLGFEASAFLEYIVRRYDTLAEYTLFVHGHERSWHHVGTMDELVTRSLPDALRPLATYVNLNDAPTLSVYVIPPAHLEKYNLPLAMAGLEPYAAWNRLRPCAMFRVHRDLVLRHPRRVYETLLSLAMTRAGNSKEVATVFEYLWFRIFTGLDDEVAWDAAWDAAAAGGGPAPAGQTT